MIATNRIIPGQSSSITKGFTSQIALPAFLISGKIFNPLTADGQGLSWPEYLYVSPVGPADYRANRTTVALRPGQSYTIIPDSTSAVWVTAATAGHRFTAFGEVTATKFPPDPVPSTFPPEEPTSMTKLVGSYIYEEYDDDEDLLAFADSYNKIGQSFLDTINGMNLPIYTQDTISGPLLDWIAAGLYGMIRPALASGQSLRVGPLNTYQFNGGPPLNEQKLIGPTDVVVTSDDTFKRILTWAFLKGDGKVFNIRWLKRRVMRFITGINGTNPNIDQTYRISVTFGTDGEVAIRFIDSIATLGKSAVMNGSMFNTVMFNEIDVDILELDPLPYRDIFKEAITTGALELPFQFTYDILV